MSDQVQGGEGGGEGEAMRRWYQLRFPIEWDRGHGRPAETWVDLLLLDQVVPSMVECLADAKDYWCIHRRWPHDENGHVFLFCCYTDAATADKVGTRVKNHPAAEAVRPLLREWPIERENGGTELATGNAHWSPETKSVYPAFIQRVCQTFCEFIGVLKAGLQPAPPNCTPESGPTADLQSLRDAYRALEMRVQELWYGDAADAFIHMTHEVFGYAPFRARLTVTGLDRVRFHIDRRYDTYAGDVEIIDIRTPAVPPIA